MSIQNVNNTLHFNQFMPLYTQMLYEYMLRNTIQHERKKRRITQIELAQALQVSRQTIVQLEKEGYVPSLVLAMRVSRYFHQPIESLFSLQ